MCQVEDGCVVECGDVMCQVDDGETCSTCPADCGHCSLTSWHVTLIALAVTCLLAAAAAMLGVSERIFLLVGIVLHLRILRCVSARFRSHNNE